jgi:hypothetical protein
MGFLAFLALIFMDRSDYHHSMNKAGKEFERVKKEYNITYFWER